MNFIKHIKLIICILITTSFSPLVHAQYKSMKFTQAWVWEYQIESSDKNQKGEMVAYFHPHSNTWLLTPESFGTNDTHYNFILVHPNGEYQIVYTDETGKATSKTEKLYVNDVKTIPGDYNPSETVQIYNQNELGLKPITAKKHLKNYLKTKDKAICYLADFNANFKFLYHFNQLPIEAKLPINFPLDLPNKKLIAEASFKSNHTTYHYKLKEISNTVYFIDL